MVGHQAIGMHFAPELERELAQMKQVEEIVTVASEASGSIVAALNDVNGYVGQYQPGLSGHSGKTARRLVGLTEIGL